MSGKTISATILAVLSVLAAFPEGKASMGDFNNALKSKQLKGWGLARKEASAAGLIELNDEGQEWSVTENGRTELAAAAPPPDPAPPTPAVKASDAVEKTAETAMKLDEAPTPGTEPNLKIVGTISSDALPAAPQADKGPTAPIDPKPSAPAESVPGATEVAPLEEKPATSPRSSTPTGKHPEGEDAKAPGVHTDKAPSPCCGKPSAYVDSKHRQCACGNTFVVS